MKKIATILLVGPLSGCVSYYHSTLEDNNICCTTYDSLHPTRQAPEKGQSNAGETPDWLSVNDIDPQNRSVRMVLKAPAAFAKNPGNYDKSASMGVFVTDLNLDANSKFTLQATLQWPEDESTERYCRRDPAAPASNTGWTVTLVAREGGRHDTYDLSRIQVSFKSTGSKVDLRVQQIDGRDLNPDTNTTLVSTKQQLSVEDHWKIFCSGQPFTLKLAVNRKEGTGTAAIDAAGVSYPPLPINLTGQFAAGSGPSLSAAGVAIANAFSPGETVSVRVKDLKIWKD